MSSSDQNTVERGESMDQTLEDIQDRADNVEGKGLKSFVNEHFTWSEKLKMYCCNHCSTKIKRDEKTKSTGNRIRHLKDKHKLIAKEVQKQPTVKEFLQKKASKELNQVEFENLICEFIVLSDQPFTVVEEDSFRALFSTFKLKIPRADTIKDRIAKLYQKHKALVQKKLQEVGSKISFVIDCWTSANQFGFQGIIVQWIDENWDLQELIIALDLVTGSHTGLRLAQSFMAVIDEYELAEKILSITTDNASNCDTFFEQLAIMLEQRGIRFSIPDQRVRCLAHIVNLACKDALSILKKEIVQPETTIENHEIGDSGSSDDSSGEVSKHDSNSVYAKIRAGIRKIRKSTLLRETLRKQCLAFGLKQNELIRDNNTRWNSTYYMLNRVMKLRQAFEATLRSEKSLMKFIPSEDDWRLVGDIVNFLQPFKKMTLYLSRKRIPTMSLSAMVYIELYNHLEKCTVENGFSDTVQTAAKNACEKLNKYYPSSDGLAFVVGTVLDPRCKLTWYKSVGFDAKVIKLYKKLMQDCWQNIYKPKHDLNAGDPAQKETNDQDDLFASQMKRTKFEKRDELQVYLDAAVIEHKSEEVARGVLAWWKVHETVYPNLAKMAKDYLCVSGTGVPIESFFSGGPNLLTSKRRSLKPETIQMFLCLKGWLKSQNQDNFKEFVHKALIDKMCGQ